ncbi:MAG TPA: serine hydrolase domain-containing protein [Pyrinomonadaceae bacterium]|nr:serine hydrolase domain-containing protein [Pyrinomonadaceae bacterium]
MRKTSKIIFAIWLIILSFNAVRADSLDKFIAAEMQKRKIPALSIAVIKDGKVVRAKGYGFANLEHKIPANENTVYEIGSISKQLASEALMLLVEDGKVNLDDAINKYLPANAPPTWEKITVRDLLNHTSGLKDWTEVKEFSYRREYTAEEFIALVRDFPLNFQPKENWTYSNTNLPLVGIIVERASGKTFEDFVNERILKLLNLPTMRFKHQEDIVPNRAAGYVLRNDVLKNGEPFRPKIIAASGGILASAIDLAKWWEAVLQGKIVNRTSLEKMLAPAKLNDGRTVAHGFAFFIDSFNGHKIIQHFGSTVGGFGSIVRYYPQEKVTVAVIGNLEDGGFGAEYIAKRVGNIYVPASFVGGLKETPDASANQTQNALQILKDIAEGKNPASMSANFAAKVSETFRKQLAENLKQTKSFQYLGKENITADHFVLDPSAAEFVRYKMTLTDKTVYYNFRINKDGKIGWIIPED